MEHFISEMFLLDAHITSYYSFQKKYFQRTSKNNILKKLHFKKLHFYDY